MSTDIRDQIAVIRAQIAEDERIAKAASAGPWHYGSDGLVWAPRSGDPVSGSTEVEDAEHITRWDPKRVLAEVKIKRELLDCFVGATGKGTSRLIANDEPWAISSDALVKILAGPAADPGARLSAGTEDSRNPAHIPFCDGTCREDLPANCPRQPVAAGTEDS